MAESATLASACAISMACARRLYFVLTAAMAACFFSSRALYCLVPSLVWASCAS